MCVKSAHFLSIFCFSRQGWHRCLVIVHTVNRQSDTLILSIPKVMRFGSMFVVFHSFLHLPPNVDVLQAFFVPADGIPSEGLETGVLAWGRSRVRGWGLMWVRVGNGRESKGAPNFQKRPKKLRTFSEWFVNTLFQWEFVVPPAVRSSDLTLGGKKARGGVLANKQ